MDVRRLALWEGRYATYMSNDIFSAMEADSGIRVKELKVDGRSVSIVCRNTGKMPSDEVVLFYLQAEESSVIRPERELFAFRRIHLVPGEEQQIKVDVTNDALGIYDRNGDFHLEPGRFRILAGGNPDGCLSASFEVQNRK